MKIGILTLLRPMILNKIKLMLISLINRVLVFVVISAVVVVVIIIIAA